MPDVITGNELLNLHFFKELQARRECELSARLRKWFQFEMDCFKIAMKVGWSDFLYLISSHLPPEGAFSNPQCFGCFAPMTAVPLEGLFD